MALIITDEPGQHIHSLADLANALKLTIIKTTPEVKHLPVPISYAADDIKVTKNTIRAMIKRGELKREKDKETGRVGVSFQSLHDLKIKKSK
jgi:hypothetical protein